MKLMDRDIKIINFLEDNIGATIEQIHELFFPSYNMAAKRLQILEGNKYIKGTIHPVLGKKVYYIKKIPSYHALIITDVAIALGSNIRYMKREYPIKKFKVDGIFILKNGQIITIEVDIFNRTTEDKLVATYEELAKTKADVTVLVVSRYERKKRGEKEKKIGRIKRISIEDIKKVVPKMVLS